MIPILVLTSAYLTGAPVQLQVESSLSVAKSEWRGDVGGLSALKIGLTPNEWLGIYFLGRLGLASVDDRMLTLVTFGAQVWPFGRGDVAPYLRLAIAHQHEETLSVVADEPFGAVFGIGDGIRHRGGFEGGLGIDLSIWRGEGFSAYGTLSAQLAWFYDPRGPHVYAGGGAGLGLAYYL